MGHTQGKANKYSLRLLIISAFLDVLFQIVDIDMLSDCDS